MQRSNRQLLARLVRVVKPFWVSEARWRALALLGIVLLFVIGVNVLNVTINYVAGRFMTALTTKDTTNFYGMLSWYFVVFGFGTPIVVLYFYFGDKLALEWRGWLTKHLLQKYFANQAYYHVNNTQHIDNPDERIAHDVKEFTRYAIGFLLTVVGSVITVCSFITILWGISPLLVLIVVSYAATGTLVTLWFGRRLIGLNFDQLRMEGDLRYHLIHTRTHRESIAFYRGEEPERRRVLARLYDVVSNFSLVIGWQRNLGFIKTSYDYLIVLIPSIVIAPMFFRGEIDFGTITRADMAFAQILAALSLVVAQFRSFSEFLAQVDRLGELQEALDACPPQTKGTAIGVKEDERIGFDGVTLSTPNGERKLVERLSAEVKEGSSLLLMGPSGCGKSSLLRVLAGLWTCGSGTVRRPSLSEMAFLPQRPYMLLGTLREQLTYPHDAADFTDDQLEEVLVRCGLPDLAKRVGGFGVELQWENVLSLGEQQRLAFARLLLKVPKFVILDEATSALDVANEARLYGLLAESGATYISVGHRPSLRGFHTRVVELHGDGKWTESRAQ